MRQILMYIDSEFVTALHLVQMWTVLFIDGPMHLINLVWQDFSTAVMSQYASEVPSQ